MNYNKIAILRNLALWDSIVYTPVLRKIRQLYPEAHITLFAWKTTISWIFFQRFLWKYIDEVILLNREAGIFEKIYFALKYFKKFDLFIDTLESTKIWWLLSNVYGKKSIWFSNSWNHTIQIDINSFDYNLFVVNKEFLLLEKLWLNLNEIKKEDYKLEFPLDNKDFDWLKQKINWIFDISKPYVIIHPSSSMLYNSRKLNISTWNNVLEYLIDNFNYNIWLIWTKDDEPIISQLNKNDRIFRLNNLWLNIFETWVLFKDSKLFIWINSWPCWISVALEIPSIILNWPTLEQWVPNNWFYNKIINIRWIYEKWDCKNNPCDTFECKYNIWWNWLCMNDISVDRIIEKIKQLI